MTPPFIATFDNAIIRTLNRYNAPLGRLALFIVYFWFGILKVIGASPATPLVTMLLERTFPFLTANQFIFFFGLFEVVIGVLWLVPRAERLVIALLIVHLITTVGPLVLLPSVTWSGFLVPTLEGQYIIKNVLIVALAAVIGARLKPWSVR